MTDVLWPLAAIVIALLAWDACRRYLSGLRKEELRVIEARYQALQDESQAANKAIDSKFASYEKRLSEAFNNANSAAVDAERLTKKVDRLEGKLAADSASRSFEGQRSQLPKVSFARRRDG